MKPYVLLLALPLLAAEPRGTVEGIAFNRVTKAGVPGVTVRLTSSANRNRALYAAITDATGAFRISGVPEGEYVAEYSPPPGFRPPHGLAPSRLPFRVGEGVVKLDAPLTPQSVIRGRVVDADARPLAGVRIELMRLFGLDAVSTTTDAEGRFTAERLLPGRYRIRAVPRKRDVATLPDGERIAPATTYFPSGVDRETAQTVIVGEGVEVEGLEIRLQSPTVYRLSGIVRDEEGKPAGGVELELVSDLSWGGTVDKVRSDADGVFEFPAVRAGEWNLQAEIVRDKARLRSFTALTMPRRDLDRVAVRLERSFESWGSVEGLPPSGPQRQRLVVALRRSVGQRFESAMGSEQPDGRMKFENVHPGLHRLEFLTSVSGRYLKAVYLGTTDVTDAEFDLAPNSPPIRIVWAANGARAAGTVEDGAGAQIALINTSGTQIRFAVGDAQGHFSVEDLRPGSWHAFAFEAGSHLTTGSVRNVVFEGGLARTAEVHHLREGETANLKLRVLPWVE